MIFTTEFTIKLIINKIPYIFLIFVTWNISYPDSQKMNTKIYSNIEEIKITLGGEKIAQLVHFWNLSFMLQPALHHGLTQSNHTTCLSTHKEIIDRLIQIYQIPVVGQRRKTRHLY